MSPRSRALALLLALAAGCRCREEAPAAPPPPAPEAHSSRGVKVPLADGWSARLGAEQSLSVGPPGRAVLRIDLRPGAAASRPDSAQLLRLFSSAFDSGVVTMTSRKDQDGYSWATFRLGGRAAGAGEPALLGAKVLGEDLFLCSTLPGATESEVESAARACEGISYSAGP
ncbi:MAG TPA: hypothetical protein VND93_02160 [Myxococcales bacterium]|nr:hypothetical protein [Myxococcales bacterium]